MNETFKIVPLIRGLCGAAVGGLIGYYVFDWILDQGFYAMVLSGALLGVGFGLASREISVINGVVSGGLALGLGLFVEWKNFPFIKDESIGYFLSHVHQLKPITLIMIGLGVFIAFMAGVGRKPMRESHSHDDSTEDE